MEHFTFYLSRKKILGSCPGGRKKLSTQVHAEAGRLLHQQRNGAVIDTKICHPMEFDFYLCSHAIHEVCRVSTCSASRFSGYESEARYHSKLMLQHNFQK